MTLVLLLARCSSRPRAKFCGRNSRATTGVNSLTRRPSCTDEEGSLLKSLLEWHRWFSWYPVPVVRKGKLSYAWLRFVERKWGTSRYSGTMKWRYRLPTRSRMR